MSCALMYVLTYAYRSAPFCIGQIIGQITILSLMFWTGFTIFCTMFFTRVLFQDFLYKKLESNQVEKRAGFKMGGNYLLGSRLSLPEVYS